MALLPTASRLLTCAAFCLIAFWFSWYVVAPSAQRLTHGYGAYYSASRLLATGEISERIYDPDYFRPLVRRDSHGQADDIFNANPPTTTLVFWPLSLLPIERARQVWTGANVVLLFAGLTVLFSVFARPIALEHALGVLALGMLFQPVVQNFFYGQAYVLVFFLLCLAAVAFQRRMAGLGGGALALALLFKTAGAPLVPLLAWQRRWRYLAWLLALVLIVPLLTLPLFPISMWRAYRELLPEATGGPWICVTAYQTTRSLLCHLLTFRGEWNPTPVAHLPWLADGLFVLLALSTLAAILIRARWHPTPGFMAMITWSVVFAPIGEQHHHTVLLIPLVWLLSRWPRGPASRWTWPLGLMVIVVCYLIPFLVNHPALQPGWRALLAYPRLYGAWMILLLCIHRLWVTPRWHAGDGRWIEARV